MKVKDLIEVLKGVDPERVVVLSCDEEGNRYNVLSDYDTESLFVLDWHEIYPEKITEEMKADGWDNDDLYSGDDGVKAVVLWPS